MQKHFQPAPRDGPARVAWQGDNEKPYPTGAQLPGREAGHGAL